MSESKRTPGPWETVKFGGHCEVQQADLNGVCVAQYVPNEADAHLIAAAPDLLEQCMHLSKILRLQKEPKVGEWDWWGMADRLDEIIAKANGQQETG